MSKNRAYLVLGAESTGARFMADILRSAGCIGYAKDNGFVQQWDIETPAGQSPILLHRSFPHGDRWHKVNDLVFRFPGYDFKAVVMVRDWRWMTASQSRFRSPEEIYNNTQRAYATIISGLYFCNTPYIIASYEALLADYEPYARYILDWLGLPTDRTLPELKDGNQKYYGIRLHDAR